MKKRLLTKTLLVAAMLLGGVISIWAEDEIIFSMTGVPNEKIFVASGTTQSITATFNTGSSAEVYNGKTSEHSMINSGKINLSGSDNSWFHAHFTTPLEEGDIITSSTSAKFYIAPTSAKPASSVTLPYTIPANSDFIGETDVYVWKDKGTIFTTFTITRPAPPTSPVITKQPKSAKYKVGATPTALTVVATASAGDLSYQWYSNTTGTADPDNDTAISGATSATLDASNISTTTLGTTYYYCVLTDDNGTTTSSVAAITIAQEFTVTFDKGEGSGIAPAAQSNILDGDKIYLPSNYTMYKEGYTLTGWTDGSETYASGGSYTVSANVTLTAVYTENTVSLDDRDGKVYIDWFFSQGNGVPAIDLNYGGTQKTGFVVAQADVAGEAIDVPLWIDCSQTEGAKFVNREDKWTQINPGTLFTIPSAKDAYITYRKYDAGEDTYPEITVESSEATYTLTAEGTSGQLYIEYIHVTLPEPAVAPTITIADAPSTEGVNKDEGAVIGLDVTGNPEPTIQWYSNTTNEAVVDDDHKIEGATEPYYEPSTSEVGTTYYYAVATNSEGSVTSDIIMVNVILVLSNECELTRIKFSNATYGAITDPSGNTHGKIEVPYLAGTEAPTATTNVGISDKATYAIEGNTLTVTAEDGETTAIFDIVKTPITPLAVPDDIETTTFTEVPSWIFNRYGFDTDKGVKFAKAVNETNNKRISKGNTRQYYFISAATKLTLTSGSGGARIINVYRNGELLNTPTSTSSSGKTIDIALDETAPCMIEIESNQTSGDGGFTKFAITGITVSATMGLNGYTTFASSSPLDLANLPEGLKAYTATLNGATLSFHQCRQAVAAGTGLLLAGEGGETYCIPKATTGESVTNALYGVTSQKNLQSSSNTYYFAMKKAKSADDPLTFAPISSTSAVAFPAGKAYLKVSADVFSTGEARALTVSFGDGATGISSILNAQTTMHDDVYTLQGQRVATPKKGLYIVNGRLVVIK